MYQSKSVMNSRVLQSYMSLELPLYRQNITEIVNNQKYLKEKCSKDKTTVKVYFVPNYHQLIHLMQRKTNP